MSEKTTTWFLEPIGEHTGHSNEVISWLLNPDDAMVSVETSIGRKRLWRLPEHVLIDQIRSIPNTQFRPYRQIGNTIPRPCDLRELKRKTRKKKLKQKINKTVR